MKKNLIVFGIIALFSLCIFTSCKKDTTISIKNNCSFEIYSVVVFGYTNGGDIISQINMSEMLSANTQSPSQIIDSRCEKVKVGLKLSKSGSFKYTTQYFMLDQGKSNVITIDGKTIVGGSLDKAPSKNGMNINESTIDTSIEMAD